MTSRYTARAVMMAAISSGQGKTSVTAALARKLTQQGLRVRVFKTGPDFLDPLILQRASGAPVENLDLWMVGLDRCRALLAQAATEADVILVEGVMGLYDGTPSSADLARAFGIPVMVVLDAGAMAQTAGALVLGLQQYGPVDVAGVIANRVGTLRHAQMIRDAMRGIPLLGTLARQAESLPERHLGLVLPEEVAAFDAILDRLAQELTLDDAAWQAMQPVDFIDAGEPARPARSLQGKTIAVARDGAFAFLYPGNLACLRELGAALKFFSPLADEALPEGIDAVYLPGGYPELHGQALSGAARWQQSIRAAHQAHVPVVAECGGMMALAESITCTDGATWAMAGILPGRVVMQTRLAAIGQQALHTPQGELRGHAFHYSRLESGVAPAARTVKQVSGEAGEPVYRVGSLTASYFHAYFPSNPAAVADLFLGVS
ncbi:cobyrinate a,c-diamide synthase [Noviherbaspirillum denitrificans]|uniref:Cobyrinic acid a,c-diamide synthase n=1 Tax=Noviherbaspirillum denitrificans TaxID=1968433 RepID=A0A254TIJ0_9BURK|nr:cobyrinate a,c-diamide synthase [Noviherbaspirillum denitrificans]OWW22404.1 cobyrinic acid a,c-diamide synthase [Noviherbaspirillum denitrificans]